MSDIDQLLITAARAGDLVGVQAALTAGADPQGADEYPLRGAAQNGHLAVVRYLHAAGANPSSGFGRFAISGAAGNGHVAVVQYLLDCGADIHEDDDLVLRSAASNGHAALVRHLLAAGANPRADNDFALRWAVECGFLDVVDCLLAAGAPIHTVDARSLRAAGSRGFSSVILRVIEAGTKRATLLRDLHAYPQDVQLAVVSLKKTDRLNIEKYARQGACPAALIVMLEHQGKTDLAATLRATNLLEPLDPEARGALLADLLSQEKQPETARATP